ncbi:MAG: hypothetical protein ACYC9O_20300, partial [Candidatus Latescibacterota bacterium]
MSRRVSILFLTFLVLFASSAAFALEKREIKFDAAGMERDAQLINLRFDRGQNLIILDDSELIEDDAP